MALFLALFLAAACASATAPQTSNEISLLFSQTADSGTLEPADGEGAYTLTFVGVDPQTMLFADRPSRYASVIPTASFVENWPGFFGDDPPNAALVEHERGVDGADSLVVTLRNPAYDAAAGTMRYDVTVLTDEDAPDRLAGMGSIRHAEPPSSFTAASLFIDDVNGGAVGGCVIMEGTTCVGNDLSGQDLTDADLCCSNLRGIDLSNANLTDASLTGSILTQANLSGAKAIRADFTDAVLTGANMRETDLTGAFLAAAELDGADMSGANLSGAYLDDAHFCNTTMPDGTINNSGC